MDSSDYVIGMRNELEQLNERLGKLRAFIEGDVFYCQPLDSRDLILEQQSHMTRYRNVLKERIELEEREAAHGNRS